MRAYLFFVASCLLAGCAAGLTTVPASDWQQVPADQRAQLDRSYQVELARGQAEVRADAAAVTDARRALAAVHPAHRAKATAAAPAAPGDAWAAAVQAHELAEAHALARVDAALDEQRRAVVAEREAELQLAVSHLGVLRAQHEVARAHVIDHDLLGSETYDDAPYRAQLAKVEEGWYAAMQRVEQAHAAHQRASAGVIAAKGRYAALVRTGPLAPSSGDGHLELAHWSVDRGKHLRPGDGERSTALRTESE